MAQDLSMHIFFLYSNYGWNIVKNLTNVIFPVFNRLRRISEENSLKKKVIFGAAMLG